MGVTSSPAPFGTGTDHLPFEQPQRGRRGHGKYAMRRGHAAVADGDRAAVHVIDPEFGQAPYRSDDVDDRVNGAHFVQVHLFRRDTVDRALHFGECGERGERASAHGSRKRRALDDPTDLLEMATVGLRRDPEIHLRARDARPLDALDAHRHAVEAKPGRQRTEPIGIEAGVHQRPEHHVARDAAEWVEDRDLHSMETYPRECISG